MWNKEDLVEKFGVADENGVIQIDSVAVKKDFINKGVYILKEIDTLKQAMKEIIENVDELGYDKSQIKTLIKHAHKNSLREDIEKLEAIQSELDNLFNDID